MIFITWNRAKMVNSLLSHFCSICIIIRLSAAWTSEETAARLLDRQPVFSRARRQVPPEFKIQVTAPLFSSRLFPYGPEYGDSTLPAAQVDVGVQFDLITPITFYGQEYHAVYIVSNGAVGLTAKSRNYRPDPFPDGEPIIAPLWNRNDLRKGGAVWFRQITRTPLRNRPNFTGGRELDRGENEVRYQYDTDPKVKAAVIVTWENMQPVGGTELPLENTNTFQMALFSTDNGTYANFVYDNIGWTQGGEAGFNQGDSGSFFALPTSGTANIMYLEEFGNTGIPGEWLFRMDQIEGVISCKIGIKGDTCDQEKECPSPSNDRPPTRPACAPQEWGPDCRHCCHCANNEPCDTRTGLCPAQCKSCWLGEPYCVERQPGCKPLGPECATNAISFVEPDRCGELFTRCQCLSGFRGDGVVGCADIDECQLNTTKCHKDAKCINMPGSYFCQCKEGFAGDGVRECKGSFLYPTETHLELPKSKTSKVNWQLRRPMKVFGSIRRKLTITSNGIVSLTGIPDIDTEDGSDPTLTEMGVPGFATFYGGMNVLKGGDILVDETTDSEVLTRATKAVVEDYGMQGFLADTVLTVTYKNVANDRGESGNTFQMNLISGRDSQNDDTTFINYLYKSIGWSGGANAAIMTDAHNESLYLPGSGSNKIIMLTEESNVGVRGEWIYRVDQSGKIPHCPKEELMPPYCDRLFPPTTLAPPPALEPAENAAAPQTPEPEINVDSPRTTVELNTMNVTAAPVDLVQPRNETGSSVGVENIATTQSELPQPAVDISTSTASETGRVDVSTTPQTIPTEVPQTLPSEVTQTLPTEVTQPPAIQTTQTSQPSSSTEPDPLTTTEYTGTLPPFITVIPELWTPPSGLGTNSQGRRLVIGQNRPNIVTAAHHTAATTPTAPTDNPVPTSNSVQTDKPVQTENPLPAETQPPIEGIRVPSQPRIIQPVLGGSNRPGVIVVGPPGRGQIGIASAVPIRLTQATQGLPVILTEPSTTATMTETSTTVTMTETSTTVTMTDQEHTEVEQPEQPLPPDWLQPAVDVAHTAGTLPTDATETSSFHQTDTTENTSAVWTVESQGIETANTAAQPDEIDIQSTATEVKSTQSDIQPSPEPETESATASTTHVPVSEPHVEQSTHWVDLETAKTSPLPESEPTGSLQETNDQYTDTGSVTEWIPVPEIVAVAPESEPVGENADTDEDKDKLGEGVSGYAEPESESEAEPETIAVPEISTTTMKPYDPFGVPQIPVVGTDTNNTDKKTEFVVIGPELETSPEPKPETEPTSTANLPTKAPPTKGLPTKKPSSAIHDEENIQISGILSPNGDDNNLDTDNRFDANLADYEGSKEGRQRQTSSLAIIIPTCIVALWLVLLLVIGLVVCCKRRTTRAQLAAASFEPAYHFRTVPPAPVAVAPVAVVTPSMQTSAELSGSFEDQLEKAARLSSEMSQYSQHYPTLTQIVGTMPMWPAANRRMPVQWGVHPNAYWNPGQGRTTGARKTGIKHQKITQ